VEIFIGLISCSGSKSKDLTEYIALRKTIIKQIPELLDDKTYQTVYFSDGMTNYFIAKGSSDCRFVIPHEIDMTSNGFTYRTNSIMFTDDIKKYNNCSINCVKKILTLHKDLSRMEFLIQIQSVFKNFPTYKEVPIAAPSAMSSQVEGHVNVNPQPEGQVNVNPPAYSSVGFIPGGVQVS